MVTESARLKTGLAAALWGVLASPALAHHAMDGKVPTTFMEGLLSGLAHPVIGPDHFAFIVAIGIAAAIVPAGIGLIGAFLAASTLGVFAHLGSVDLPLADVLAAGSVVVAGAMIAAGRRAGASIWLGLMVVAGLIHGYALGESIVGADRATLGAYLLGLAVVSAIVATAIMLVTRGLVARSALREHSLRAAGVVLGCAGVILLAVGIIG
jgi:urease accessory protein